MGAAWGSEGLQERHRGGVSDSVHPWRLALGSLRFRALGSLRFRGPRRGAWLALGQPFGVPGGSRVQGVWEPSL